jgi:hypothetical protein
MSKESLFSTDITPRKISSHDFKLVPHKFFRIVNEYFESVSIDGKTDPLFKTWGDAEEAVMKYLQASQTMRGKYTIVVVYINLPVEK